MAGFSALRQDVHKVGNIFFRACFTGKIDEIKNVDFKTPLLKNCWVINERYILIYNVITIFSR